MSTKQIILGLLMLGLVTFAPAVRAHGNEHGTAKLTLGKVTITIDYARPTLRGRDLNKMIQPGQMWRLGADVPTTLESNADLDFGGRRVPKGKHVLLARYIEPGRWRLVVSSKPIGDYEPSAKLAEEAMELETASDPVEAMTIKLSAKGGKGVIEVQWGTARLAASFAPAK